jgi:hypothetical protein
MECNIKKTTQINYVNTWTFVTHDTWKIVQKNTKNSWNQGT